MEIKDIVIAAGNEDINSFEKNFSELLMIKVNSQINNARQEILSSYNTQESDV